MKRHPALRHMVRAISFLCILFLLLTAAGNILAPKDNTHLGTYDYGGFYGLPKNTLDTAVIGDSNASEGIVVPQLWGNYGYTCYTSGGAWHDASQSYRALKEILSCQKPKLVILETDTLYQGRGIAAAENSLKTMLESWFPSIRFHNRFKDLKVQDFFSPKDYSWVPEMHGYSYRTEITPYSGDYMADTGASAPLDPTQLFYLNRIVSLCRKHDIKLLLLSVPSPNGWSMAKHKAVSAFAASHEIPFLDYNAALENTGIDWQTDTRDATHLNYSGARKVTASLGEYLSQNYRLPDRRGQAGYEKWQEDYEACRRTVPES
ncbi:hypothetical protein [Qiania dongpingensis]|uniref:SGNH/GDSL hydrolase family protein n=1 Tax=Qiania dongpingensis TaxID=2763669 RepID=A0A7G9G1J1_9FIRM|nr:hypothetical protein [Qiania dongpingensis]QNM04673.1 hypothetical protein H9Q78_09390 [Qiania dongpingensis]